VSSSPRCQVDHASAPPPASYLFVVRFVGDFESGFQICGHDLLQKLGQAHAINTGDQVQGVVRSALTGDVVGWLQVHWVLSLADLPLTRKGSCWRSQTTHITTPRRMTKFGMTKRPARHSGHGDPADATPRALSSRADSAVCAR